MIPKLTHAVVGLHLTAPVHPQTGSERTFSIRTSLQSRLDYILPDRLLLETPDGRVARYVERAIERRLGLRDEPVRGELRLGE